MPEVIGQTEVAPNAMQRRRAPCEALRSQTALIGEAARLKGDLELA
jgi:hypothetical protein